MSKIFNPDMAVIGNFVGATGKNTVNPMPALALEEAEATFQAVVDPYARADFFLAFSPEGVEIEEGFLTLTSLPGGLLAKVGKLKEQVGKVNTLHAHALPWVDKPLMIQNLFGGDEGLSDAGVSVSKLILNPFLFLEATGEIYQGSSGLFQSYERSDVSWAGRLRGYRDVTESTNIDVGGSFAYGTNDAGPDFTTRLAGIDATFRYRPLRRAIYRRFQARTELFWSRRGQEAGTVHAFGMYGSGEYQFARRWFAGARYDWSERAYDASLVDKGPSLVLTFWPSEFSQIRGQYPEDAVRRGCHGQRVPVPVPLFDRRPRGACLLSRKLELVVRKRHRLRSCRAADGNWRRGDSAAPAAPSAARSRRARAGGGGAPPALSDADTRP